MLKSIILAITSIVAATTQNVVPSEKGEIAAFKIWEIERDSLANLVSQDIDETPGPQEKPFTGHKLFEAAEEGNIPEVKRLIQSGHDPFFRNRGTGLLDLASYKNTPHLTEAIMQSLSVENRVKLVQSKGLRGQTAIQYAAN